jgi:hypothetical protein
LREVPFANDLAGADVDDVPSFRFELKGQERLLWNKGEPRHYYVNSLTALRRLIPQARQALARLPA